MRPELVIISDDEHQYDSQDTTDWYRRNFRGIPYVNNPFERRYVVTTRNDGSMKIEVAPNGGWLLQSMYVTDWPQKQPELQDLTLGALPGLGTNSRLNSTGMGRDSDDNSSNSRPGALFARGDRIGQAGGRVSPFRVRNERHPARRWLCRLRLGRYPG